VQEAVTSSQQLSEAFAKHAGEASNAADRQLEAVVTSMSEALRDHSDRLSRSMRDQLAAEAANTRQEIATLEQKDRSAAATTLRWALAGGIAVIVLQLLLIFLVVAHI
jgi:CHASE3 domain sensor protein